MGRSGCSGTCRSTQAWYRFLQFWNSADRMYPAFRVDPDWETPDVSISLPNEKMRRIMTAHLTSRVGGRARTRRSGAARLPAVGKAHPAGQRLVPHLAARQRRPGQRADRAGQPSMRWSPRPARSTTSTRIVFATGFHPNKFLWPMEVTARGVRLTTSGARIPVPTSASPCPVSRTCSVCTARTRTRSSAVWSSCSNARSTT